jgi:hypothetical protein
MKKLSLVCTVVIALGIFVAAKSDAAKAPKDKTVKGWVSDSKCAAKGANADHASCGNKCVAAGEKVVLVTDKGHKVLNVDNPDTLKDHMAHHVAVKGMVDSSANTIHVDSVTMLASQGGNKAAADDMKNMH